VGEPSPPEVGLSEAEPSFEAFVAAHGEPLRRALVAAYGVDVGTDACAEALAFAWEHWDRVGAMERPAGYLFRVGQSASRKLLRRPERRVAFPAEADPDLGDVGARLDEALVTLSPRQRTTVLLVHGHGYSYAEVAALTGRSLGSVRNDVHRAMKRLRARLEAR
jgi:RNA polymerase sigma factor (sigma-70 family)